MVGADQYVGKVMIMEGADQDGDLAGRLEMRGNGAGSLERTKGQKRSSTTALPASRPASKAKVEAPRPAVIQPMNLMDQVGS
jgi:hypothetical protein